MLHYHANQIHPIYIEIEIEIVHNRMNVIHPVYLVYLHLVYHQFVVYQFHYGKYYQNHDQIKIVTGL